MNEPLNSQQQQQQQPGMPPITVTNRELLTNSPVFRLLREHPIACTWLQTSEVPETTSATTLHNSVTKEFQCHIPVGSGTATHDGSATMERRSRTLLYSPFMTLDNGITLGCVFGSRYGRDQVWGLGWEEDGQENDGRGIRCKFVYDERHEESLTFIWNVVKGEVAVVWVKGVSVWEMRRELFVFEFVGSVGVGVGGIFGVLEGKRRKVWLKVRQLRECEVCGVRMDACACGAHGRADADRTKLMTSPVDFTSFDVKVLDGVYQCVVEANIYNPDSLVLLSRKSVKFTTEIVTNNGDGRSLLGRGNIHSTSSSSQGVMGTGGLSGAFNVLGGPPNPVQEKGYFSEKLLQHLQRCADVMKTEDESMEQAGHFSVDPLAGGSTSSVMTGQDPESVESSGSSATKRRNAHKTQPILLADIVNTLYRLEKEGESGESGSDGARKRRKKRGPYRKRGEIDKATRDHERKLKNRELAHAANQKKRERTRAMELEVRILRKAVRSILGYTRELEDVNSILAHIVAQSSRGTGDASHVSTALTSMPIATSPFPEIVPGSLPEEKPHII